MRKPPTHAPVPAPVTMPVIRLTVHDDGIEVIVNFEDDEEDEAGVHASNPRGAVATIS